jgi:hypothetical protein
MQVHMQVHLASLQLFPASAQSFASSDAAFSRIDPACALIDGVFSCVPQFADNPPGKNESAMAGKRRR